MYICVNPRFTSLASIVLVRSICGFVVLCGIFGNSVNYLIVIKIKMSLKQGDWKAKSRLYSNRAYETANSFKSLFLGEIFLGRKRRL